MKQQVQRRNNGFERRLLNTDYLVLTSMLCGINISMPNGILWLYRGYFLPGIEGILISFARESFASEQHR